MKVPKNRQEWIEYLVEHKAVPIWTNDVKGNVYFRRLTRPTSKAEELVWGKHIFGKETRQRVAEILGIMTKTDCEMTKDLIKERILSERA